ncbi:hypothetical protein BDN72DRAFT_906217 [Pluteus cervinus]|uniref:Uncharacterized protein n=1 Tax=Pluteus cervinus TaxID=181527 RepID=A0ACD3A021_9AGAR|nr:hypothetical protein BDN72DRAFT_906217 [Pluteus cervinus]
MSQTQELDRVFPRPAMAKTTPTPFESLRFSPVGLYDLRRNLSTFPTSPGLFRRNTQRFLTSDIAWFSGGACNDGNHQTSLNSFHQSFHDLRTELPPSGGRHDSRRSAAWKDMDEKVRHAVFDLTTCWDRAFGGSTIVIHVEGTLQPGAPVEPEYIRAYTYLPPITPNIPEAHKPIVEMVQVFIRHVGIPSAHRFRDAAEATGWQFTSSTRNPVPYESTLTLPQPVHPSSLERIFFGASIPPAQNVAQLSDTLSSTTLDDSDDSESEATSPSTPRTNRFPSNFPSTSRTNEFPSTSRTNEFPSTSRTNRFPSTPRTNRFPSTPQNHRSPATPRSNTPVQASIGGLIDSLYAENEQLSKLVHSLQQENSELAEQIRFFECQHAPSAQHHTPKSPGQNRHFSTTPGPSSSSYTPNRGVYPHFTFFLPANPVLNLFILGQPFQPQRPYGVSKPDQPMFSGPGTFNSLSLRGPVPETPHVDKIPMEDALRQHILYMLLSHPPTSWLDLLQPYSLPASFVLKLVNAMNKDHAQF